MFSIRLCKLFSHTYLWNGQHLPKPEFEMVTSENKKQLKANAAITSYATGIGIGHRQ